MNRPAKRLRQTPCLTIVRMQVRVRRQNDFREGLPGLAGWKELYLSGMGK
jgi:hypothetical protein